MTTVYFVRHAEPNYDNHDDVSRELSPKGLQSSKYLVNSFATIQIDAFCSSLYLRAMDTIKPLADSRGQIIHLIPDFRERKITDHWIDDFTGFTEKQWADFHYHLPGGESLSMVQERNIRALEPLLQTHPDQTILIGTHGTALSTIINYYKPDFQLADFHRIKHIFPWIVQFEFQGSTCSSIDEIH
jgi:2,3-bisphosphoglycerate-dependent phosphoglycerate mutase